MEEDVRVEFTSQELTTEEICDGHYKMHGMAGFSCDALGLNTCYSIKDQSSVIRPKKPF